MRIAVLMNIGIPWSRDTARILARLGHEVHVIDFTTDKTARGHFLREDGFQGRDIAQFINGIAGRHWIASHFRSNLRYATSASTLRRILDEVQPDVLLTLYSGGFATLAQLSGFRPFYTWVVGSDVLLAGGLQKRLLSSALTSADLVLVNGDHLAVATRALAPEARVESLLLGIDIVQFTMGPKADGPAKILNNRGFNPIYQNDFIVRALAGLEPDLPFEFVFASAGPELAAVKALAEQILPAPFKSRVSFAGGVSRDRMLSLLAESRYFVSMARSDGTATSLLEAMASGVYPILSDIPQNREWVKPEWRNGLLVPLDDPRHLTRVLRELLGRPKEHAEAVAFNRRQVERRADAQRNLEHLVQNMSA